MLFIAYDKFKDHKIDQSFVDLFTVFSLMIEGNQYIAWSFLHDHVLNNPGLPVAMPHVHKGKLPLYAGNHGT